MNSVGDKMKRGAACHLKRRTRMMREDENLGGIRGIVAPPAFPGVVEPLAAHGAEHVAAHDPGTDALERAFGKVVVDARGPILASAVHCLKHTGGKEPLHQVHPLDAKGMVDVLIGAGAEAVEGDAEAVNAK